MKSRSFHAAAAGLCRWLVLPIISIASLGFSSGCRSYYGRPPSFAELPSSAEKSPKGTSDRLVNPSVRLIDNAIAAEKPAAGGKEIIAFVDSGITYSDILFDRLFDSFKVMQDNARYDQNLANIIIGGAVGILGLTGSETKALGILGVSQTTMNADFQNYSAVYLLSPALGQLHDKVAAVRRELAVELLNDAQNLSYDAARRRLNAYHNTGSLLSIQEYLRKSVDVAKFSLENSETIAKRAESEIMLSQFGATLDMPAFDGDGAFAAYLVFNDRENVDKLLSWYQPETPGEGEKMKTAHVQQRGLAMLASWLKSFTAKAGAINALSASPEALQLLGRLENSLGWRDRRRQFDATVREIEDAISKRQNPTEAKPFPAGDQQPSVTKGQIVITSS